MEQILREFFNIPMKKKVGTILIQFREHFRYIEIGSNLGHI